MRGLPLIVKLAYYARLAAALGLCLLSARFSWLALDDALGFFASEPEAEPSAPRKRRSEDQQSARPPEPTPPASAPRAAAPPPRAEAPKALQTRTLLVQLGPPRSEVFVNGRRLGETPFAGQWTCADGDPLKIQVVPRRGIPLERHLPCGGSTLLVGLADGPKP